MREKGLPSIQGYQRGDQLIHINVWTPKHVNDEERRILEKMRDLPNFKPKPEKEDRSFFDKIRDIFS